VKLKGKADWNKRAGEREEENGENVTMCHFGLGFYILGEHLVGP
jgi:hypothetical protein